jgi:hypothetical protein
MRTPWGPSQSVEQIAPGIKRVDTASHGGYKLDASANAKVPDYMREDDGWYEEDVDWSIVATVFPEHFDEAARAQAENTLRNWLPAQWETFYGRELGPGESHAKDEARFHEEHKEDWLVISAVGDWHAGVPKGMVLTHAARGGRTPEGRIPADVVCFLVPDDEYGARTPFGFVIDESRHERARCP